MDFDITRIRQHYPAILLAIFIIVVAFVFPGHHRTEYDVRRGDVTGFTRDCVTAVLKGETVKSACQSLAGIHAKYGVDAEAEIDRAQGQRTMTARRILRGDIVTDRQYMDCIHRDECADISLVPVGGNPDSPTAQADRAIFWHLAQNGSLTASDCTALPICRAMLRLKLIPQPPAASP